MHKDYQDQRIMKIRNYDDMSRGKICIETAELAQSTNLSKKKNAENNILKMTSSVNLFVGIKNM